MEPQAGATLAGAIFVLANVLLFWVREWLKHKSWSKNDKDLKEIKIDVKSTNDKVDCIDKKVGETNVKIAEVKTAVNTQARHCKQTVERFDKTIGDQNKELISLAKNSGRKR